MMAANSANPRPADVPPAGVRSVMNIQQAAAYLGVSKDSLYRYASDGEVPAFKLGNRWRFRRELLDKWMTEQSLRGVVKK